MDTHRIPCVIMRGGTSKGIFLEKRFLPEDPQKRDAIILAVFGSPDKRQIDGLGGSDPLTSKLAIISPSDRPDADVNYTFGQVGIDSPTINYSINCGNISSAVGPYVIDEGMVKAVEPSTTVRILNTNTQKMIIAEVPVQGKRASTFGNYKIHGVPGTGPEIRLTFQDPAGAVTGALLPTGKTSEEVSLKSGRTITVSLVDAGTLYAFVPAEQMGLTGIEKPEEIEGNKAVMEEVETLRKTLAQSLVKKGVVGETLGKALTTSLKVAVVGKPATDDIHVAARIINPGKVHKAFAVTGAICTATAALMEGTTVYDLARKSRSNQITIGHPSGSIDITVDYEYKEGSFLLKGTRIKRTARRLMEGFVYLRPEVIG